MLDSIVILALPLALALGPTDAAAETPTATETPTPADSSGFLYGRVETRHETHEGRLVWPRDRFWTDFLDATKSRRPHVRRLPAENQVRTESVEIFGRTFERRQHDPRGRSLRVRFGDIARLEPHSTAWTTVVLRDGSRLDAESGLDISRAVTVVGADGEETRVDWKRIRAVVFLPTPGDLAVDIRRLYGAVTFRHDEQETTTRAYFRWDADESTSDDVLDGHTTDGREHKIPFAEIRALEPRDDTTLVTLADGRELELGGTNDVDRSNRGLEIELGGGGRRTIAWRDLVRVELEAPPGSGPGYDAFETPAPLEGTVTTVGGESFGGWLAFDADEDATWEILDVVVDTGELALPFGRVHSIERGDDPDWPWRVALDSGETVAAAARDDLGERNPGMLVYARGATDAPPRFVPWDEVARVELGSSATEEGEPAGD